MNYEDFVSQKLVRMPATGIDGDHSSYLHPSLFPHQRDIVTWALRRGRCAIFADTGLGKTAMQLSWALGLLHKTIRKDSAMSRQGIPDYVVTFRKPGVNPEPIAHTADEFPVLKWQRYASPVWTDINPSDTLQYRSAREHDDERHVCPLQLEVIRRCVDLWTNKGDIVWSPFAGIGSEGVVSLEMGRRFVGAELKESYFKQAVANLAAAETQKQPSLFDALAG
jgi:hypothetical protein